MNDDEKLIWHPYSQHGLHLDILPVASAQGAYLRLADGREILDAISSWWVNIHGHGHPKIAEAIGNQARRLDHVIFAGFTHEPATRLARILVTAAQRRGISLAKVFYSDNGSTAVEVALKLAFQFHLNRGVTSRRRFIALRGSYHGDTLGAMAVGEPEGFHTQFQRLLAEVDFVNPGQLEELDRLTAADPEGHAAFIFEPLVQGAGGMKMYSSDYLREAVALCRARGILTIADEVFTGFYRTGKCFALEHAGISPDLLCLSKGITGGTLPLAATLATEEVFAAFLGSDLRTAFLHGHSYTANPIACAAALASWELLQSEECQSRVERIISATREAIATFRTHPRVASCRSLGTIGAIELKGESGYFSRPSAALFQASIDRGALLRPLGNVIYAVPPYCMTEEEIKRIYQIMKEVIEQ